MGRPGEGPAGPAKGEPMSLHTDHDVAPATARLRALLHAGAPVPVLDAYDALSARIVESAGYSAIWASGLGISASYGLRDNNEASWTQILDSLELMAEATDVPILVDGDSGFGNFNNVRRFVKKIGQRGLAGVCIEDKAYPKANSFAERTHELCPAGEFCGKIRAAKDSQPDDDFVVVARTEALIAGHGLDAALARAEAYRHAGADAILVHSKAATADEVAAFAARWDGRAPLVVVPTTYADTPAETFQRMGVSLVIWANFTLRAAIQGIENACAAQRANGGAPEPGDARYAPLQRVFELTNEPELRAAEQHYLPAGGEDAAPARLRATGS